jgi:hypothetical protein
MKTILFKTISLLLVSTVLVMAGTTGKIAGIVTDSQTGQGLAGANVIIEGTLLGGAADVEGFYYIINVPVGTYSVEVNMMGYETMTKTNVGVSADETTELSFELSEEAIAGEAVTIVAERPIVEKDLTGSKQVMSTNEISASFVNTVDEAIEIQSGVNIHGGVRGGFGLDVTYLIDGAEVRDVGSNTTYLKSNVTAIEEMQLLTGGYNAEYGKANGAIVNIMTKTIQNKWHGSIQGRMRPAGVYHWGRNFYDKENFEWVAIKREYFENNSGGTIWNDYWETVGGFTPDADFNYQKYQEMITPADPFGGYADRTQWELQGTVYGPITSKIGLMLSGRYFRGVTKFPSALDYNPEYNGTAKLDIKLTQSTNLKLTGIYQQGEYSAGSGLAYISGQDNLANHGAAWNNEVRSPFNARKFWNFGAQAINFANPKPPEYLRSWSAGGKLTHVFSPRTFLEFSIDHQQMKYDADYRRLSWSPEWVSSEEWFARAGDPYHAEPVRFDNLPHTLLPGYAAGDVTYYAVRTHATNLKLDLLSQINSSHQIKAGLFFSPQYVSSIYHMAFLNLNEVNINEWGDNAVNPYEGGAYFQDKIEIKGMTVNLGLRFDFYNVNKKVNYTIWDPAALSDRTEGNKGIGIVSFDPDGPHAVHTKTQYAVSPRIGIAHQITASTVLHFMYGHFNQRPVWTAMSQQAMFCEPTKDPRIEYPNFVPYPDDALWCYLNWMASKTGNPALEYEKMIQYEVGVDQNIADLFRLDATLYYKDGHDLINVGLIQDFETYGTSFQLETVLRPDPVHPFQRVMGQTVSDNRFSINGGHLEARGAEFTLETLFMRYVSIRAVYNMSWTSTGRYGPFFQYLEHTREDGSTYRLGVDTFWGGDDNNNEVWNPVHTLKFNAHFNTPEVYGPNWGGFFPLGDWYLDVYHQYASPQRFTYHSVIQGDYSTEPLNRKWKAHHKTNIRLAKGFRLLGLRVEGFMDVINLFNNKVLNLMSGEDLTNYMEYGKLPYVSIPYKLPDGSQATWVEDDVWTMYSRDLMPREIFFGLLLQF